MWSDTQINFRNRVTRNVRSDDVKIHKTTSDIFIVRQPEISMKSRNLYRRCVHAITFSDVYEKNLKFNRESFQAKKLCNPLEDFCKIWQWNCPNICIQTYLGKMSRYSGLSESRVVRYIFFHIYIFWFLLVPDIWKANTRAEHAN